MSSLPFYEHKIRVRYHECDRMGFLHHSVYAVYFEEARTEILRSRGITYKEMEDEGIIMPVRSMKFLFKKAAIYDDLLTVRVSILGEPKVRMTFKYEIYNQNGDFLSDAETELFFVNKSNMRPMALPEKFLNQMY